MQGVDVLCEVLESEGVRHLFGNPGTTELPLIAALADHPSLDYVLGLQESTVIGMADGYARITGRPAFVNVHAQAGLGAAIGNLTNAVAHRAPLVVTAGNADGRHAAAEPLLSGDLVGLAAGVSKWGHEARHPSELGVLLRRAFRLAEAPPRGPVFLSLPSDVLEATTAVGAPPSSSVEPGSVAGGLDRAVAVLIERPERLVVVAGDPVAEADAAEELVRLVDALGCPVYGSPFFSRRVFPTTHPCWRGMLPATADGLRAALDGTRAALLVDEQAFLAYQYTTGPSLPDDLALVHLSPDRDQIGRTHPVAVGLHGDVRSSLAALADLVMAATGAPHGGPDRSAPAGARSRLAAALADRAEADARLERSLDRRRADAATEAATGAARPALDPMLACQALLDPLPRESIVVDEAITTGNYLRGLHRSTSVDSYWFCRGGGLGWGMPAAVGLSLGSGGEPVLAVIGDGSAMYAPQALWTAARRRLPVVFAVVDNGEYAILRRSLRAAGSSSSVGLDLGAPDLDFVALGASMGVPGTRVGSEDELRAEVAARWGGPGPSIIHVDLARDRPVSG